MNDNEDNIRLGAVGDYEGISMPVRLAPGGENAVEEREVAAQKYPRALQSRTDDKTICLPSSATE
jgi:hypothetical protein